MTIYSRVDLFSNYPEDPQNIDVRPKDGSKDPRLQFKESLGIGFQVNF